MFILFSALIASAWNITERKEEKLNEKRPMIGHTDMVMDLHYLNSLDTLASASLDANICIWDLYTGRVGLRLRLRLRVCFSAERKY